MIWGAYLAIPIILLFFTWKRQVPFPVLFWVFALFILSCGMTHLVEAITTQIPVYRLLGVMKVVTALVSWGAVLVLIPAAPRVLSYLNTLPSRLPERRRTGDAEEQSRRIIVALLAGILAILVRLLLDPLMHDRQPFMLPLLAVVAVAWYSGFWPATLTHLLSFAAMIYLFVPPRGSLLIELLSDQLGAALYLFGGVACAMLGESQRVSKEKADAHLTQLQLKQEELQAEVEQRRQVEADLRDSGMRFRLLAETIPHLVWTSNATGGITYLNRHWESYTGRKPEELAVVGFGPVVHPEDGVAAEAAYQEAIRRGQPYVWEMRVHRARDDTYRWHLASGLPIRDERGRILEWVGTLTDVDEHKRQAETLERLVHQRTEALEQEIEVRRRTEESQRLVALELQRSNQELERFAYIASHDLQEPLRKIQAFSDRLIGRFTTHLDAAALDYLERMRSAAQRMRQLIEDLLSLSRVTSKGQSFVPVDLNDLVAEVLSDLEVRLQQTGGVVRVGPLPVISGDPGQLRQVFQNLLNNALKFHKPGEPPQVEVRRECPSEEDSTCRVIISDHGIGFDNKYRDRIFQIFQRLHGRGEYEGTGIGLAIARKIVERHHGTISATGTPGAGATFVLTFPRCRPATPGDPAHDQANQPDHDPRG